MDLSFWPRLSKCCCCLPLRVGCLIIGYASLLLSLFSLSAISISLYKVVEYVRTHRDKPDSNGHSPDEIAQLAIGVYITHAYYMVVCVFYAMFSVTLIIGVHKRRSRYVRYCFDALLVLLVLAAVLVVTTCVFFSVLAAFPVLKWCIILFYCLLVVRSAYLEMEEQNRPKVFEMQSLYSPKPAPIDL